MVKGVGRAAGEPAGGRRRRRRWPPRRKRRQGQGRGAGLAQDPANDFGRPRTPSVSEAQAVQECLAKACATREAPCLLLKEIDRPMVDELLVKEPLPRIVERTPREGDAPS